MHVTTRHPSRLCILFFSLACPSCLSPQLDNFLPSSSTSRPLNSTIQQQHGRHIVYVFSLSPFFSLLIFFSLYLCILNTSLPLAPSLLCPPSWCLALCLTPSVSRPSLLCLALHLAPSVSHPPSWCLALRLMPSVLCPPSRTLSRALRLAPSVLCLLSCTLRLASSLCRALGTSPSRALAVPTPASVSPSGHGVTSQWV